MSLILFFYRSLRKSGFEGLSYGGGGREEWASQETPEFGKGMWVHTQILTETAPILFICARFSLTC